MLLSRRSRLLQEGLCQVRDSKDSGVCVCACVYLRSVWCVCVPWVSAVCVCTLGQCGVCVYLGSVWCVCVYLGSV